MGEDANAAFAAAGDDANVWRARLGQTMLSGSRSGLSLAMAPNDILLLARQRGNWPVLVDRPRLCSLEVGRLLREVLIFNPDRLFRAGRRLGRRRADVVGVP